MAFWYAENEDRAGAWHWIGIAISLCQANGLHRLSRFDSKENCILKDKLALFQRIWWSCVVRDRWLSLAMGRPMRINLDDCDTPEPSAGALKKEWNSIPPEIVERYLPKNQDNLVDLWINLLDISKALGSLIHAFYRLKGSKPNIEDMKRCETEVLRCALGIELDLLEEPNTKLYVYQLRLFYENVFSILFIRA